MFPSRGWVGTPRLVDVGTDGGGARRPSEEKRANGTSLTAVLTLNSHARTSEHTAVRREHARISLHRPRQSAPAKLCGALRRCLGAAPEGGQSKSARPGTNARHIDTNEAIADAMNTRGRRGCSPRRCRACPAMRLSREAGAKFVGLRKTQRDSCDTLEPKLLRPSVRSSTRK